jgi:ABC-type multidrug transport system ATPase subunit
MGMNQLATEPDVKLVRATSRQSVAVPLQIGAPCVVGSGADSHLRLDDAADRHVQLLWRDERLYVEPLGGAPVALNGRPVSGLTPVEPGDWLALGERVFQVTIQSPASTVARERATVPVQVSPPRPGRVITIGRSSDNDIDVPLPAVSRHHARITEEGGAWAIEDLGSMNGTFVDERRVEGRAALRGGERIEVASAVFIFRDGTLRPVEGSGSVRIEARGVAKTVSDAATGKSKNLLTDVSLAIEPGEFVGIFGTSGSGKSTLLDALNGRRPATAGAVTYNGSDLYRGFDLFRATIGYVPQQDIVHRRITIRSALTYTARLRLPEDTTLAEIESYVTRVLTLVGLAEKAEQPIDTPMPLSGGQFKRVSLAIELVSNPSVLFLDEVTSGLDAGTDKRMMQLFAELAGDQKTVVCVTHTLENVDNCHLVVVLFGGRLAYFGPPDAMADHFQIRRLPEVYDALERAPAEQWAERYATSALHRDYVARRLSDDTATTARDAPAVVSAPPASRWFDLRQARILTRRYIDLLLSDRRNLAILLAQAPIIGAVIGVIFKPGATIIERATAESHATFMMVISAIWFGCLNACREIVKERPVYLRERSVNLGIGPYLASKVVPLAGLCAVQCVVLLAVVMSILSIPGSFATRAAALFLSAMAATALGLAVSAVVTTTDKAVSAAPILLILQVVLANAIVTLEGVMEVVAKATMVSYWSYDAMKATLADEVRAATDPTGKTLVPIEGSYGNDMMILAALFLAFLMAAVVALRRQDRAR